MNKVNEIYQRFDGFKTPVKESGSKDNINSENLHNYNSVDNPEIYYL